MPPWIHKIGWTAAFAALAARAYKGLSQLDEPLAQDQPARWPPLAFENPQESTTNAP
jgi:uncharacterized membrane protein YebE (DUF533 family)